MKKKTNAAGRVSSSPFAQGGVRTVASAIFALFAFATTNTAQATDYVFTGKQDNKWGTGKNWYVYKTASYTLGAQQSKFPSGNHNLNFTGKCNTSGGLSSSFVANPVVNITGNYSTTWKIHVRQLGTESKPVVFKADTDARTITAGNATVGNNTGYHIGSSFGDAWLRLEKGKYQTGSKGYWFVGSSSFQGHVISCSGVAMGCGYQFQLKNGSFSATNTTLTVGDAAYFGFESGKDVTVHKEGGVWTLNGNAHVANAGNCIFVQDGGKIDAKYNLYVGNPGTGSLTVKSGDVNVAGVLYVGRGDNASKKGTGTVIVDGGAVASGGDCLFGDFGGGTGTITLNGGTFSVAAGKWTKIQSGGTGTINLNGGTFYTTCIHKDDAATSATVSFNGGTLQANASNTNADHLKKLVGSGVDVKVCENGGTINLGGFDVIVGSAIVEDPSSTGGGMTFKGGGTVTLASGNTYTGATTVEIGTTVHVDAPGDIPGTIGVIMPETVPDAGDWTLAAIDGEGVFDGSIIAGVAAPADCTLRLSEDEKSIICNYAPNTWIGGASGSLGEPANWSFGSVPESGAICVIGNATPASLTNPAGSTFAPSCITFATDSAAVTISGEGEIAGVATVINKSSVSHTIGVPVRFAGDIQVKQAAMADANDLSKAHVTFAAGAYAAEGRALENDNNNAVYSRCIFGKYHLASTSANPWTVLYYGETKRICVADNSELHIPCAGNLAELDIGTGAKVYVENAAIDGVGGRASHKNYGEMTVGNLVISGSGDKYVSYNQEMTEGRFKFRSVTNSMTGNWCYLGDGYAASRHVFYIGEGGLNATGNGVFCIGRNFSGNSETVRPWYSDFSIASVKPVYIQRNVEFCTDDGNNEGRTITIDAATCGGDSTSPAITVSGSGTLQVNNAASNSTQPAVTVTGTATLAFAKGASLTTAATAVNGGATLKVSESGTVALGGNLVLDDDAILGFDFSDQESPPVLGVSSVTLSGSRKTIKVKVGGERPMVGKYVLTSGGKFVGENKPGLEFAAGSAGWAKNATIEDGDVTVQVIGGMTLMFK